MFAPTIVRRSLHATFSSPSMLARPLKSQSFAAHRFLAPVASTISTRTFTTSLPSIPNVPLQSRTVSSSSFSTVSAVSTNPATASTEPKSRPSSATASTTPIFMSNKEALNLLGALSGKIDQKGIAIGEVSIGSGNGLRMLCGPSVGLGLGLVAGLMIRGAMAGYVPVMGSVATMGHGLLALFPFATSVVMSVFPGMEGGTVTRPLYGHGTQYFLTSIAALWVMALSIATLGLACTWTMNEPLAIQTASLTPGTLLTMSLGLSVAATTGHALRVLHTAPGYVSTFGSMRSGLVAGNVLLMLGAPCYIASVLLPLWASRISNLSVGGELAFPEIQQSVFWAFGHPEVYVIALPVMSLALAGTSLASLNNLISSNTAVHALGLAGGTSHAGHTVMAGTVVLSSVVWAHHLSTTTFITSLNNSLIGSTLAATLLIGGLSSTKIVSVSNNFLKAKQHCIGHSNSLLSSLSKSPSLGGVIAKRGLSNTSAIKKPEDVLRKAVSARQEFLKSSVMMKN